MFLAGEESILTPRQMMQSASDYLTPEQLLKFDRLVIQETQDLRVRNLQAISTGYDYQTANTIYAELMLGTNHTSSLTFETLPDNIKYGLAERVARIVYNLIDQYDYNLIGDYIELPLQLVDPQSIENTSLLRQHLSAQPDLISVCIYMNALGFEELTSTRNEQGLFIIAFENSETGEINTRLAENLSEQIRLIEAQYNLESTYDNLAVFSINEDQIEHALQQARNQLDILYEKQLEINERFGQDSELARIFHNTRIGAMIRYRELANLQISNEHLRSSPAIQEAYRLLDEDDIYRATSLFWQNRSGHTNHNRPIREGISEDPLIDYLTAQALSARNQLEFGEARGNLLNYLATLRHRHSTNDQLLQHIGDIGVKRLSLAYAMFTQIDNDIDFSSHNDHFLIIANQIHSLTIHAAIAENDDFLYSLAAEIEILSRLLIDGLTYQIDQRNITNTETRTILNRSGLEQVTHRGAARPWMKLKELRSGSFRETGSLAHNLIQRAQTDFQIQVMNAFIDGLNLENLFDVIIQSPEFRRPVIAYFLTRYIIPQENRLRFTEIHRTINRETINRLIDEVERSVQEEPSIREIREEARNVAVRALERINRNEREQRREAMRRTDSEIRDGLDTRERTDEFLRGLRELLKHSR